MLKALNCLGLVLEVEEKSKHMDLEYACEAYFFSLTNLDYSRVYWSFAALVGSKKVVRIY